MVDGRCCGGGNQGECGGREGYGDCSQELAIEIFAVQYRLVILEVATLQVSCQKRNGSSVCFGSVIAGLLISTLKLFSAVSAAPARYDA